VLITPLGREFIASDENGRKRIFHRQVIRVPTFAFLIERLRRVPNARLPAEIVREDLAIHLPNEPTQELFHTIVAWGRYGELIGYDPDADEVFLLEQ
jgi:hypothetical protein